MDPGRGEERVRCMDRVTWKLTVCKRDSQLEFAVCLRENQTGALINLEGWDGEGEGREVQEEGEICIPMAD